MSTRDLLLVTLLAACAKGRKATTPAQPDAALPPETASGLPAQARQPPAPPMPRFTPTALAPSDLAPQSAFGDALGLDGDVLAVGAPGAPFSELPGRVHVFERSGGAWKRTATLAGPPGSKGFGHAVAVSRDTLAVAVADGPVSIFGRSGKTWSQAATIALPASEFRVSLALEGDTLAVGITDWEVNHEPSGGMVVIYQRSSGAWHERARLLASDAEARAARKEQPSFGWRVALDGDRLVASSRQASCGDRVDMCGAAYLFERSGDSWTETLALPTRDLERWAGLGWSVASQGGLTVLSSSRRVWVLTRTPAGWRDAGTLDDPRPPGDDGKFGDAVAVHGSLAAVSIVPKPPSGPPPTLPGTNEIDTAAMGRARGAAGGSVQLYVRQPDGWNPVARLARKDDPGDELGEALAMGDGVVVAGAPGANGSRGEVVIYQAAP